MTVVLLWGSVEAVCDVVLTDLLYVVLIRQERRISDKNCLYSRINYPAKVRLTICDGS